MNQPTAMVKTVNNYKIVVEDLWNDGRCERAPEKDGKWRELVFKRYSTLLSNLLSQKCPHIR